MAKDLTGYKFGKWTVVSLHSKKPHPKGEIRRWNCVCDCGNSKSVLERSLTKGVSKSCGCYHKELLRKRLTKHNMSNTRLYSIWHGINERCTRTGTRISKNYGDRGISVCDEWKQFEPFHEWAIENGYSEDLSIDRINVNGNYEPSNCRWVDVITQANNTRNNHYVTIGEETFTITQWARLKGISTSGIYLRVKNGMTFEEAITKPVKKIRKEIT